MSTETDPTVLRDEPGRRALAAAAAVTGLDPVAAVTALRRQGLPAGLAGAALTQARLRERAAGKFGPDAAHLLYTEAGLAQATRGAVAARRAARYAAAGLRAVTDLCCGLGADAIAFARAGLSVRAFDADPTTAALAEANAAALGLPITVQRADVTTLALGDDPVFCDPARRSGGHRRLDPDAWSPPWPFLRTLTDRTGCLKLGPGIDHDRLPAGTEAEWVSVGGEVVEAALWCGALPEVPRRATVLPSGPGPGHELTGTGDRDAEVGPVCRFLYDPDGAVVRSHLVAELADRLGATLADEDIAYLYADHPTDTPFARRYEVTDVLPFSVKRLRAALRSRRPDRLTIKKRGSAIEPEDLRRTLRLPRTPGGDHLTVVLTRVAGAPTALICR